ncbi:MAG: CBS domain-containing protein [Actinomycetota bacterium]
MKTRELMTTDVTTIDPQASLKEAARLMASRGVSGLPVVEGERVVGVITEADFVERSAARGRAGLIDALLNRQERLRGAGTVGEVMSRPVVSIGPDAPHTEAAQLMQRRGVKRLVVVDEEDRLLGVLSRGDLLVVFTRPDAVIEQDIRHRIMGQVLAIEPHRVSVEVEDGKVLLTGSVQARTEAALLEELVATVDGVWSVDADLRYLVDDTKRQDEPRPFGVPRPNW